MAEDETIDFFTSPEAIRGGLCPAIQQYFIMQDVAALLKNMHPLGDCDFQIDLVGAQADNFSVHDRYPFLLKDNKNRG